MTGEAASYRCSGVTRDNGRACRRLGHRLENDGRRWCGTHGADAHIKSPVPCAGLGTDGMHCRKTADVITIVDTGSTAPSAASMTSSTATWAPSTPRRVTPRRGTTLAS